MKTHEVFCKIAFLVFLENYNFPRISGKIQENIKVSETKRENAAENLNHVIFLTWVTPKMSYFYIYVPLEDRKSFLFTSFCTVGSKSEFCA